MNETTEATAIFAPLWKRKWLILAVGILVAVGTYVYYKREASVYSSSTQLFAGEGSGEPAAAPTKKHHKNKAAATTGPTTGIAAQVNSPLMRVAVAQQLRSLGDPVARSAQLGTAKAKTAEGSEFTTITAEARSPKAAALLANTVAQVFVARQHAAYIAGIKAAIATTRGQLRAVEVELSQPGASSTLLVPKGKGKKGKKGLGVGKTSATLEAATLSSKINQYEAALLAPGISQFGSARATSAHLLRPMPKQNAIFGFGIGLFLACVAAYFLSRFDRRLRSLTAVEAVFGTHILTALPSVRHPIVRRGGLLAPSEALSEPLRRLHTGLQLSAAIAHGDDAALEPDREHPHRSILFLSPDAGDGKSTVVAALALVQRDSDEHVAVVEADFRRPVQAKLLGVSVAHGLAEVLAGALTADEAMQPAESAPQPLNANSHGPGLGVSTLVESRAGRLSVLVGAPGVPNPPALLASRSMARLLHSLADEFDYTLIDAPPPLQVSDVMPLLPLVDGIVLIARVGHTREISALRLAQILRQTPSAPVLGAVANDVSRSDLQRYGFYSPHGGQRWLDKLIGR